MDSDSTVADGFDSSLPGGYAVTKNNRARVLSNGPITLKGRVFGNVLSANGNVALLSGSGVTGNVTGKTISGSGFVTGIRTIHDSAQMLNVAVPAFCAPPSSLSSVTGDGKFTYNPTTGDLTLGSKTTVTLAAGDYCFRNIVMGGGASIRVMSGQVLIRVNGIIDAGGGSFTNLTSIPTNLRIESSYQGSQGVALGGGNNAFFTVYAPGTDVQLKGGGTIFGAVVGKTLSTSGVTMLHYDNANTRAGWTIWSIWGSFFGLPAVTP